MQSSTYAKHDTAPTIVHAIEKGVVNINMMKAGFQTSESNRIDEIENSTPIILYDIPVP